LNQFCLLVVLEAFEAAEGGVTSVWADVSA
jgi:hypothetical protein